jgi:flagellar hook-associated protein 1 FlgK
MAAQATTSHNISNATTPGYNRQEVVQSSAGGINYGYGFVGQGAQVTQIKRIYNDFLTKQALARRARPARWIRITRRSRRSQHAGRHQGRPVAGLQDFFAAIQNLASNPNTQASRQSVLSQASTLVARVSEHQRPAPAEQRCRQQPDHLDRHQHQLLRATDRQAEPGHRQATGSSGGQQPNDLLDQRDQLVAELNKYVKITTVPQDSGGERVHRYRPVAGDGRPITQLTVTNSPTDVSRLQVGRGAAGWRHGDHPGQLLL